MRKTAAKEFGKLEIEKMNAKRSSISYFMQENCFVFRNNK